MHSLALCRFLLHFLFVLFRGCWAAELSCYHDTFSVWSDTSHESLDTTSRQESKLNINKEFNKKQLRGLRCQVSRASIISWVSLIIPPACISPLWAVDCCLTFNQNKTPPVLCLLTKSKSSWVVFTSPDLWLINSSHYGLFIYDKFASLNFAHLLIFFNEC